jgi:hypothetical protein
MEMKDRVNGNPEMGCNNGVKIGRKISRYV